MSVIPPQTTESPISGHPAETPQATETPVEQAPVTQSASAPQTFTPVYVGARRFDTSEELASYTAQLEATTRMAPAAPAPIAADPDKELADLMFEDPRTAIKVLKQEAKAEFRQEMNQENASKNAWTEFYRLHPDLVGVEDMVEAQSARMAQRIRTMPLNQAMKEIGSAVRGRLTEIRKAPGGGTVLPNGPAITAGSSGGPGAPVQVPRQPKSFVEQMQALRSRGKK